MKKYLIALIIGLAGLSMAIADAEARRLGGGSSFGKQTQGVARPAPQQSPAQATSASQARPAAAPGAQVAASPWRALFGGALLGLGLGALLAQFGIGGALASIISAVLMAGLLILAATFIYRMLRGRDGLDSSRAAYAGAYPRITPQFGPRLEPIVTPLALQGEISTPSEEVANETAIPEDFDAAAFVRSAKTYFIRLQAAWDRADIEDIREFTSPEMFAELRMQLHERGASSNDTEVVSLDGEVLGVEANAGQYVVSVRFFGLIKEASDAPAEPFSEAWNLSKPVSGPGGWVLAGIQQLS
jgi:predicted lipid-binding transport protein (Tim44 family)